MRLNPHHSIQAAVQELTTQSRICFSRVWCLLRSLLGCAICGANWVVLWYGLNLGTGCVGSGASWMYSGAGHCQTLLVTCPGLPFCSYTVIHSFGLPPVLLGVHGRGQATYQSWLPLAPIPCTGQQKAKRSQLCQATSC